MAGFFSGHDFAPNRIEPAFREAENKKGFINLAGSNPTCEGLIFPPGILKKAAEPYWGKRLYSPDPKGSFPARSAISGYYKRRTPSLQILPDDIFVTASTSESYSLLFALLADPGDNFLAPKVSYPLFEHLAAVHHIELRTYGMDEADGWSIRESSLLSESDERTRAVIIVSPHNPTGMIVQKAIPALDRLGLPVICDEVFAGFPYEVSHIPPLGALHGKLPVFHLNGISKMFGLPDLKLGWIALSGTGLENYEKRLELLNDTYLGANYLVQSMLPAIFEEGAGFAEHMRKRVCASIDCALELFAGNSRIKICRPDGGYYLFPKIDTMEDEEELVLRLLKDRGVLVHPGYYYDCDEGIHIMISCLTETGKLSEGLKRIVPVI
ncbi:MAG: pyridoxal phosphate-dependent aminotransferase [Desulfobacteraceae bacterium]|nr:MAG: pyridoxal phosphate-dependent aminotransferase [Desulfobacteraceae bacterium]